MSSPSKSPTMEPPPVQQSHPHPKASNSVTEATANSGSPSHKPLQQLPHEAAARTRTRTHRHVANNGSASSSAAQEADHRFSDEEEELNNFNNNQKKQQDSFLSSFPPGYRFNPRDEELVRYYLQKKIMDEPLPPNKIMEVNLYRHNPETLAGKYDTYGEKEWYFFTPRDRKYRNGKRPNRRAGDGYWKATGADKSIRSGNVEIGFRKALVFYSGKPPKGKKTNWIMHEYRVPDSRTVKRTENDMRLDNWVLCRIYKKVDNKNKIQEAELAEENISMSIPDDTEMEMNGQVDNTQATEYEGEYPHTIAHPPLEFDKGYPNFAYHYTSYLGDQPMIDALNNNMRHHLIQPIAFDSKDSYGNMYHSLPTRGSSSAMQSLDENCVVPFSEHKCGCSVNLVDMTSKSVVCKEESLDQKYGVQFPGQKYVVQSHEQEKTHCYGKSVQPSDAVDSRHNPSAPCLDQKSIQQEIGKSLLSPPSDDLPYCIQEQDGEHDNLLFSDSNFTYSEAFSWL